MAATNDSNINDRGCGLVTVVSADVVDAFESLSTGGVVETMTFRRETADRIDVVQTDAY